MILTTEAILLRAYPYGESSLILRLLTLELGAVRAMAKGTRRGGGRGAATPSTFDRGTLELAYREGRDLQTVRDFRVEAPGRGLGADLPRFTGASLLAEIVLAAPSEEPSGELYATVTQAVDRLVQVDSEEVPGEVLGAAWGIFGVLGFAPNLEECVRCGVRLGGEETARFDAMAGGLRCPACGADAAGPRVGPGARRDLAALVAGVPPTPLRRPSGHLRLLEDFAVRHLELRRKLRSASMLRDVLRAREAGEP